MVPFIKLMTKDSFVSLEFEELGAGGETSEGSEPGVGKGRSKKRRGSSIRGSYDSEAG